MSLKSINDRNLSLIYHIRNVGLLLIVYKSLSLIDFAIFALFKNVAIYLTIIHKVATHYNHFFSNRVRFIFVKQLHVVGLNIVLLLKKCFTSSIITQIKFL